METGYLRRSQVTAGYIKAPGKDVFGSLVVDGRKVWLMAVTPSGETHTVPQWDSTNSVAGQSSAWIDRQVLVVPAVFAVHGCS